MPDRDELEFDDEEEGAFDEEYEEYEDDEEGDYEDDEDYEDYDDEDGEPQGGGWKKAAAFAIVAFLAIGGGAYFFLSDGNLPFLAKQVPPPSEGPFANPGGFGKIVKSPPAAPPVEEAIAKQPAKQPEAPKSAPAKPVDAPAEAVETPELPAEDPAESTTQPVANQQEAPKVAPAKQAVARKPVVKAKPVKQVTATKRVTKARPIPKATGGGFAVQVGSFQDRSNAENLVASLKSRGYPAWITGSGGYAAAYSVRSTLVDSQSKAEQLKQQFAAAGHPGAVVSAAKGRYYLQLGIFSSRANAQALADEISAKGLFSSVATGKTQRSGTSRVLVGSFPSPAAAEEMVQQLRGENVPAIVIRK